MRAGGGICANTCFLVPEGTAFGADELEANLQEDLDPQDGENLSVDRIDTPAVIIAPADTPQEG